MPNPPTTTNLLTTTNPLTITNPQSPIPNHRLYACLYGLPGATTGDLPAIARAFSPRYQVHNTNVVVIDVSGLERLLGPAHAIGDELRKAIATRGIRAHVAIAATQTAAIVLAHTRPGLTVIAAGEEASALASVAIGILAKFDVGSQKSASAQRRDDLQQPDGRTGHTSDFTLQTFQRWGIRTLGELAALPDSELVSRFGRHAVAWQMLARGVDQRPLVPTLDEERFEASLDLEWPIEGLEPLSFVLTRLLEPLCTRLERRDCGAAVLHVLLDLVDAGRTEAVPHIRRLELPTPMRDVRSLRTLALLDLESHPPDAAIDRVTIVIDPTPGRVLQHALFTRAQPTPEQLSTLLARLGAVMGQDRVGAPTVIDSYRPGAFGMVPFATIHENRTQSAQSTQRETIAAASAGSAFPVVSAIRRCRQPVPARVAVNADGRPGRVTTDRRGYPGGAVVHCAGPWRTSGDWWTSQKSQVTSHKLQVTSLKSGSVHQPAGSKQLDGEMRQTSDFTLQTSGEWDRDEWDVALSDGAVYRVFRDRSTDAWFIDAVVD